MTAVLDVQSVTRAFTAAPTLDGVTFAMQREEMVALLGRNGTGKTTLVKIIMGMLFPDAGTVHVFGLSPVTHPVEVKRRIGYVGETPLLPLGSTIPELVAFHRSIFPSWDGELETQLLERFGLAGNGKSVRWLSKGQHQQVALLLAVCHRPELLLLDEPASGLDPVARREFLETSIQLLNREGTAILFSSHHMTDVERLGGRVLLLDEGKIRLDRELDALREAHTVAVIARSAASDSGAIERIPGCLNVRAKHSEWHAVFQGEPTLIEHRLKQSLGTSQFSCTTVPLEELFVELVGERKAA